MSTCSPDMIIIIVSRRPMSRSLSVSLPFVAMSGEDTQQQVVELLNAAATTTNGNEKIMLLAQAQELIMNKDSTLLDNFYEVRSE